MNTSPKSKKQYLTTDQRKRVLQNEKAKIQPDKLLTEELKQYILDKSNGVALVGVAPIDRFDGAPEGHRPSDFVQNARSVVVIALPIVSGLTNYDEYMEESQVIKEVDTYTDKNGFEQSWNPRKALRNHIERRCSHEIINIELQTLSMYGALFLEKSGYTSTYLPTTYGQTFSWPGNIQRDLPHAPGGFGPFSHRHAAVAAGLGEFGLNNLLLTPQYGPRNRFVSIITRAPLAANPLITKPICLGEKCSLCIKNCRANAFGDLYDLDVGGHTSRLAKIDRNACTSGFDSCYKKCLTICPVGRKPS